MKIGSHVSMSGKEMLVGSVKEMLSYEANAMMIYTGAPQNTRRKELSELRISEAHKLLQAANISCENIVIHAPYIINLANSIKPETFEIAVDFLQMEIKRTAAIGAKYIVLHPGAHVTAGIEVGLNQIVKGLNIALAEPSDVIVCLETMAGKGTELGITFEQLRFIIDNVDYPDRLGICLDTCHINDAGYDLTNLDDILDQFDTIIGLDRLHVIHLNDSKNEIAAAKDRHANLGYGTIGFEKLLAVYNHPKLVDVVKLLETPYVENASGKKEAPYKKEIEMLRAGVFQPWLDEDNKIIEE